MAHLSLWHLLLVAFQVYLLTCTTDATMTCDYGDALGKTLLFFEAQRSGKLPPNQRVTWRGDSGLSDGSSQNVNLVGGYYDAGDHVKFGLPMAYSVTVMAWAAVDFRSELVDANQMDHTLEAIRWGTDYFMKAHCERNVLWAQVGDGEADHSCWERAEDMTTPRTAFRLDSSNPGSDLAGETAAALAAASLAIKPYDSSYSNRLLEHAKTLFSFADNYRGQYDDSYPSAEDFYPSSGYSDELLWAAAWLYRATNNDYYLQYTVNNAANFGGTGNGVRMFSWDNKYAGLQILLSKVLLDGVGQSYTSTLKEYKAKADFFACAYMQKNTEYNVAMTPGGLAYLLPSNNLQYAASASFLLAVYSDYLSGAKSVVDCPNGQVQPHDLLEFAKSQADYILGNNPQSMSYLIGYGSKYPEKSHHRDSSMPSIDVLPGSVGCVQGFESWYKSSSANPNVLNGALVGGPDSSDCFTDDRDNYEQNEPTTSAAAPLIGLFSKLHSVSPSATPSGYDTPTSNQSPSSPKPQETTSPYTQSGPTTPEQSAPDASFDEPGADSPQDSSSAPASSPDQPQEAIAPSSEIVDYVLSQPQNSTAIHERPLQYLALLPMLVLMPIFAII